jgi:hypothetical protein
LIDRPDVEAEEIVREAMKIASDLCVYTNHQLVVETIVSKDFDSSSLQDTRSSTQQISASN